MSAPGPVSVSRGPARRCQAGPRGRDRPGRRSPAPARRGPLCSVATWVVEGASWLLDQIGAVLSATTSVDLGAGWFTAHYQVMVGLAAVVMLPLLLLCRSSRPSTGRARPCCCGRPLVQLPPGPRCWPRSAVQLVQLALAATDALTTVLVGGRGPTLTRRCRAGARPRRPGRRRRRGAGLRAHRSARCWSPSAPSCCGWSCWSGRPPSTWPCCSFPWPWPAWSGRPSRTGAAAWSTRWWPWSCPSS